MKYLLYWAAVAALLSSCNQSNQNENGRYVPFYNGDGYCHVLDTQTGRVYIGTGTYKDYVEGSIPK
jgi:hypothetical protein